MYSDVIHHAKVLTVSGKDITLEMDTECRDACGGCMLHVVCAPVGRGGRNLATVVMADGSDPALVPGDRVEALVSESSQWLAIGLEFGAPLLLLLAVVIVLSSLSFNGFVIAAIALGAVAIWDLVLLALRRPVRRRVKWRIKKI